MADQRIEKWAGWIDGTIKNNVFVMHLQREAWKDVSEILAANPGLPESYWWEFMRDTYATTQAVAVRRQADLTRGVASLGKLIEEIGDDPSRVTKAFWLGHNEGADAYWLRVAEKAWGDDFGGDVDAHLDPSVPTADLVALTDVGDSVRHYVDKHVAHADASAPEVTLTLGDIHDAIDVIGRLFSKYSNLLTGVAWASLVPAIQHNWKAAFAVPWMKPRQRDPSGDTPTGSDAPT